MKKTILLIILTLIPLTAAADKIRMEFLFVHYSVGYQMVSARCEIRDDYLDTFTVVVESDTADIKFRSYHTNYEASSGALSDTIADGCSEDRFNSIFTYDLRLTSGINRTNIWDPWQGNVAGLLTNLFDKPFKEDSVFWRIFIPHNVPGPIDSLPVKYDVVLFKNPYATWGYLTQVQAGYIRNFYRAVRDSIAHHPEINVGLVFGTPLRLGHFGQDDSTQAKITYNLATWFASDSFFTHNNAGPYRNVWKLDTYRQLCETDNVINKYCLAEEYHADEDVNGSHLSDLGAEISQTTLAAFIRQIALDLLYQKNNIITRSDIDLKIYDFQNGQASEDEVLQLIEQYHDQ